MLLSKMRRLNGLISQETFMQAIDTTISWDAIRIAGVSERKLRLAHFHQWLKMSNEKPENRNLWTADKIYKSVKGAGDELLEFLQKGFVDLWGYTPPVSPKIVEELFGNLRQRTHREIQVNALLMMDEQGRARPCKAGETPIAVALSSVYENNRVLLSFLDPAPMSVRRYKVDAAQEFYWATLDFTPSPRTLELAQSAYDLNDWEVLSILADSCEEDGCSDAALLEHLRLAGEVHFPGCWTLDLILGKE